MTVTRQRRTVEIARLTEEMYFTALLTFGAREAVALAAAKGLITFSTKGK